MKGKGETGEMNGNRDGEEKDNLTKVSGLGEDFVRTKVKLEMILEKG